jgi:hypothetical protein
MPSHLRALSVAIGRQIPRLSSRPLWLFALAALLHGCAGAPGSPTVGPNPSNPSARTGAVGYRSTTAPYVSRRPVDPAPWREQNERVAPPPGATE